MIGSNRKRNQNKILNVHKEEEMKMKWGHPQIRRKKPGGKGAGTWSKQGLERSI